MLCLILTLHTNDPIKAKCCGITIKDQNVNEKQTFYSALFLSYESLYQMTLAKLCISILNCVSDTEIKVSSDVILPYA